MASVSVSSPAVPVPVPTLEAVVVRAEGRVVVVVAVPGREEDGPEGRERRMAGGVGVGRAGESLASEGGLRGLGGAGCCEGWAAAAAATRARPRLRERKRRRSRCVAFTGTPLGHSTVGQVRCAAWEE
jgi:hypothetical protein